MKIKNILLILLIITPGCKDEFLLELKNYEPIMVVEGLISNEPGPYTIKLSFAIPINETLEIPFEGCTVTLFENTDKSEVLTEKEPGLYVTSETGIQGVIGNKYRISIITPEGLEYETEFQEMKEPVEIESVYAELIHLEKEGFQPFGLPGYQFYTDTKTASSQYNYLLWKMIETYEYTNDYVLYDIYFGIPKLDTNHLLRDPIIENYRNNLFRCWKTQNINYIFTGKTSNLTIPKITGQPLYFVGTNSKRLQERYSLLLKQYTIGEDAFHFWNNVEKQSTEENFLIVNQPCNIIGNIKNKNNPDEIIYGYFTTASVTQKRIFVDRPKERFYYDICTLVTDPSSIAEIYKDATPPFYLIEASNVYGFGVLRFEYCVNCTLSGGSNIKPDFWVDK